MFGGTLDENLDSVHGNVNNGQDNVIDATSNDKSIERNKHPKLKATDEPRLTVPENGKEKKRHTTHITKSWASELSDEYPMTIQ